MAKENLKELTTEDLIKKKKQTSLVTGILAGMLTVLLVMAIMLIIKEGVSYLSLALVSIGLSPILFLNYNMVSNINKELKSRNFN